MFNIFPILDAFSDSANDYIETGKFAFNRNKTKLFRSFCQSKSNCSIKTKISIIR